MEEQDINFTDNAFARNTEKNVQQCEPSKRSFFYLDKNYHRENTIKRTKFYHYHKQKTYQQA